jgi:MYXO-CTERM domain-containing protein
MPSSLKLGLERRLNAYSATIRSSSRAAMERTADTALFAHKTGFGKGGWCPRTPGGTTDPGRIRLEYSVGANGAANEIEAFRLGVRGRRYPNHPGEVSAPAPEPSTDALALLAGVAALRRRRKAAV